MIFAPRLAPPDAPRPAVAHFYFTARAARRKARLAVARVNGVTG